MLDAEHANLKGGEVLSPFTRVRKGNCITG